MTLRRFQTFLIVLSVMIVGLMALGAGVRTMNAGLSCPDWPLCYGKVIPDFHPAVWFEFVHRAYAGVVAILYAAALVIAFRSKEVPASTKLAAKWGLLFLSLQILMGGLTVLLLVKAVVVTTHLLLATLFLSCVLWMWFGVRGELVARRGATDLEAAAKSEVAAVKAGSSSPAVVRTAVTASWLITLGKFLPLIVFLQIAIGGLVASTYAGSVCVDWPLCNGQWVPTWQGAIGLQIIHRFFAYGLVVLFLGLAMYAFRQKAAMSAGLKKMFYAGGVLVVLQTIVGIANLMMFIPPHITVLHQTLAMLLLAVSLNVAFRMRTAGVAIATVKASENPAAAMVTPS